MEKYCKSYTVKVIMLVASRAIYVACKHSERKLHPVYVNLVPFKCNDKVALWA